jgi:hypothetical protein
VHWFFNFIFSCRRRRIIKLSELESGPQRLDVKLEKGLLEFAVGEEFSPRLSFILPAAGEGAAKLQLGELFKVCEKSSCQWVSIRREPALRVELWFVLWLMDELAPDASDDGDVLAGTTDHVL